MKKCKCSCCNKLKKVLLKLIGGFVLANIALFIVFFFDLDGKLLYYVVEPFMKKRFDNMERKDMVQMPYDMDKYPKYKYDEI